MALRRRPGSVRERHPGIFAAGAKQAFLDGVTDVAERLGVTRQTLSALLNGRAGVSAEMALRLEGALGTSAEMWVEMQAGYDLWVARKAGTPKVSPLAA